MDPTHALYRGQLFRLPRLYESDTRKSVEKQIRALEREVQRLESEAVVPPVSQVQEGEWTVYLSVSARKARGAAMGHCLGGATGGYGRPYIAVGRGDVTYGFELGPLEAIEVRGRNNETAWDVDWDTARGLAEKYAHLASWATGGDAAEASADHLAGLHAQIGMLRARELALAIRDGRITPSVSFDVWYESPRMWAYSAPAPENTEGLRAWLLEVKELGLQVQYHRVYVRQNWVTGGYSSGSCLVPARVTLDHYDPELEALSACAYEVPQD